MKRFSRLVLIATLGAVLLAGAAWARGLGVDVWTDRGDDAVYQPGEGLQVKARTNDDAYLLVYSISTEGDVRVLWPLSQGRGYAEGRRTYRVPPESADYDLVADAETGQGYIVALASVRPFRALPWYLRSVDLRGEDIGYENYDDEDESEGVTREGRIVGDPFVAMERIRRRVLENPSDDETFATAYSQYYVHQQVRYPRYVCYDCHRPTRWAWWDGFDPYYAQCRVIDFRVNWGWAWGPTCWNSYTPYYFYVFSDHCPPHYRRGFGPGHHWSSWDGWHRWNDLWGGSLRRYKTPPPANYTPPPPKGVAWRAGDPTPPGFIGRTAGRGPTGVREPIRVGRPMAQPPGGNGTGTRDPQWRGDGTSRPTKPGVDRMPGRPISPSDDGNSGRGGPREGQRPTPTYDPPRREDGGQDRAPSPRQESPRYDPPRRDSGGDRAPSPRQESPRQDPPRQDPPHRDSGGDRAPAPRQEAPRVDPPHRDGGGDRAPAPRQESPRQDPPRRERDEAPRGKSDKR